MIILQINGVSLTSIFECPYYTHFRDESYPWMSSHRCKRKPIVQGQLTPGACDGLVKCIFNEAKTLP